MKKKINQSDLISFGNYLLSKERKKLINSHPQRTKEEKKVASETVSDADVENWLHRQNMK